MPAKKRKVGSHALGDILSVLDAKRQALDLELGAIVSANSQEIILTYAETILLIEGSQTGTADCTLPPYVLYEAGLTGTVADTCIRSELLEWCLDSKVSQSLLKSGFLEIEGATILSSLEFNADEKVSLTDNKDENNRDERFSLDLDNKSISVDFYCTRCWFSRGITLSDSYTENLIFENVRVGKSYVGSEAVSFRGANASIVGDLKFISKSGLSHSWIRQDSSILGTIILDRAKIDGLLQITNNRSNKIGNIQADYLQAKVVDFSNSSITGLTSTYSQCQIFDLSESYFDDPVYLYLSQIDKLFCINSKFYGRPSSLNASGIKSRAVFLRDGFFALHGVMLHKSEIEGDLDCSNGFFGFSLGEDSNGLALTFRNSKTQNAYFSDGFVSLEQLDISSAIIDNLYFRRGVFIDPYETYFLPRPNKDAFKTYAINANNCKVNQKINFNLSKGNTRNSKLKKLIKSNEGNTKTTHQQHISDIYAELADRNLINTDTLFSGLLFSQTIAKNTTSTEGKGGTIADCEKKYEVIRKKYQERKEKGLSDRNRLEETLLELRKEHQEIENVLEELSQELVELAKGFSKKQSTDGLENLTELREVHLSKQIKKEAEAADVFQSIKKNEKRARKFNEKAKLEHIRFNYEIHSLIHSHGLVLSDQPVRFLLGLSLFSGYQEVERFLVSRNKIDEIDRFSIVYGEAFFEEVKVDGEMDCAGAIFYRKSINDKISKKTNVWRNDWNKWVLKKPSYEEKCDNALTLSHAKVDGTFYLNCGDGKNQVPFLSRGEVDLQHASFKQLFITPSLAVASGTRWNLIGTTYEAIDAQYEKASYRKFNAKKLTSCCWIYPYFGRENFRQPYEQLANTLFKSGEDVSARKIIVSKTPSRNSFEAAILTAFVRLPFRLGFPVQRAVFVLSLLALSGVFTFRWGHHKNLITQSDLTETAIVSESATSKEIPFNSVWYSFQKLMPLVDGEQEESFTATYEKKGDVLKQGLQTLFYTYYNLYPLSGAFLIAMILLSLARMRKNSS